MRVQPWISRLSALVSPDLCEAGLIDADCERDKVVPSSGLSQWLSGKATACSVGDSGDVGSIPYWEDPLEKEMATHSSILAWRTPWTEEPGRFQSMGSQKS